MPSPTLYVPDDATLAAAVRGSNAVEGIYATVGMPGYDDHLAAAQWVRANPGRAVAYPRVIHERIMAATPYQPGYWRHRDDRFSGYVTVGGRYCPHPQEVPGLMRSLIADARAATIGKTAATIPYSETLWALHHQFEWVHPFLDGNGRTGRLWLMALRQSAGYPWVIVDGADDAARARYYRGITDWIAEHRP